MEEHVFKKLQDDMEDRSVTMDNFDFNNGDKENKYLIMKLSFWIMELFPAFITTPFIIAREQSQLDKADAELVGLRKSDKAHSFANIIEAKVNKSVEEMNAGNHDNDHHTNQLNTLFSYFYLKT